MKWEKKGWFGPKLVSEDGKWEIYDGEFGHAAVRLKGTNRGFLLKARSIDSQEAIAEAEARIREYNA